MQDVYLRSSRRVSSWRRQRYPRRGSVATLPLRLPQQTEVLLPVTKGSVLVVLSVGYWRGGRRRLLPLMLLKVVVVLDTSARWWWWWSERGTIGRSCWLWRWRWCKRGSIAGWWLWWRWWRSTDTIVSSVHDTRWWWWLLLLEGSGSGWRWGAGGLLVRRWFLDR